MKSIELSKKTETVSVNGMNQEVSVSTLDLIKSAVNNIPQGGFTTSDMADRLRILDAIEGNEGEVLNLEDSDYANVKKYVSVMKWSVISRSIIDFTNSFTAK